jgi:SPASM domain peptide maturase of grasp-with-spasm system
MINKKYFKLYSHCIPVKGFKRSTICDLQREDIYYVPNSLAELFIHESDHPWEEIVENHSDNAEVLDEYLDYLIENDLGFWTDEPGLFPALNMNWESSSLISNAIVDIDDSSVYDFGVITPRLIEAGCRHIQIRFYRTATADELRALCTALDGSLIRSLEIIVKYTPEIDDSFFEEMINSCKRIKSIFIHSAPETRLYQLVGKDVGYGANMGNILFTTQCIDSNKCCGMINPLNFSVNLLLFTESQQYNSCLNRKVGIDVDGSIKNCPSSAKVYGNIYKDSLVALLESQPSFQDSWHVKKDLVDVCKVCEHRYVCTDCRVFTEDKGNEFSKPAKCTYDPYTATWSGEMMAFNKTK